MVASIIFFTPQHETAKKPHLYISNYMENNKSGVSLLLVATSSLPNRSQKPALDN